MDLYQSVPLSACGPSVRLLELDLHSGPGEANNTIRATLTMHSLDPPPEYEALSYVWGSPQLSHTVMLNDHAFAIQTNLYDALEHLRNRLAKGRGFTRMVWIDAICINQMDNTEKSSQVMLMGDVYAKATRVLVWLGKSDQFSKAAFDTLAKFAVHDGTKDARLTSSHLRSTRAERREAVQRTIMRPYFERAWVVQEVVSAKEAMVCCGEEAMSLDTLLRGISRMTGSGFFPFKSATAQITNLGIWRECFLAAESWDRDESLDLRILFLDTRNKQCKNARDKVYSLRAIGSKSFSDGINVDYNKTVEEVYVDCARHLLKSRTDLRVLSSVILGHRQTTTLQLPFWVPDWTQPQSVGGVLQRYYRFAPERFFRAANGTKSAVNIFGALGGSMMISIRGKRVDTISKVLDIRHLLVRESDAPCILTQTRLTELAEALSSSKTYLFTGEPTWKASFRTLTADRSGVSWRVNDDFKARYLSPCGNHILNDDDPTWDLPDAIWEEISKSIYPILEDMDMFTTECGYIGLGHKGILVGDLACIFLDGEVPFLLRLAETSQGTEFEFLCESYVHGVIDGEVMREIDSPGLLESFLIR